MRRELERSIYNELHSVTGRKDMEVHREETLKKIIEVSVRKKRYREPADWNFLFWQLRKGNMRAVLIQLAIFLIVITTVGYIQRIDEAMKVSRHIPLLLSVTAAVVGMAGMAQMNRAARYHMIEIEAAARISRRKIQLIQSGMLLLQYIIIFAAMFGLLKRGGAVLTYEMAVYILLPYLLVCIGSNFIQRYVDSSQADYVNAVFGIGFVSLLVGTDRLFPEIFGADYQMAWFALTLICLAVLCRQGILEMKQRIEYFNISEI